MGCRVFRNHLQLGIVLTVRHLPILQIKSVIFLLLKRHFWQSGHKFSSLGWCLSIFLSIQKGQRKIGGEENKEMTPHKSKELTLPTPQGRNDSNKATESSFSQCTEHKAWTQRDCISKESREMFATSKHSSTEFTATPTSNAWMYFPRV